MAYSAAAAATAENSRRYKHKIRGLSWIRTKKKQEPKSALPMAPCCGVDVLDSDKQETKFYDKSVQCDELDVHDSWSRPIQGIYNCGFCYNTMASLHHQKIEEQLVLPHDKTVLHLGPLDRTDAPIYDTDEQDDAPRQILFRRKNVVLAHTEEVELWQRARRMNCISEQGSTTHIPNYVDYGQVLSERTKVSPRRKTGASNGFPTGKSSTNREIIATPRRKNGAITLSPNGTVVTDELHDEQARLVLGINNRSRNPLNYKMYTPFHQRQSMPPEHFKCWPSQFTCDDDSDTKTLKHYSDAADHLSIYERRSFCTDSSHDVMNNSSQFLSTIDSKSIMYRSKDDCLDILEDDAPEAKGNSKRYQRSGYAANNDIDLNNPRLKPAENVGPFSRLSGSIQNLLNINRSNHGATKSGFSQSENCLNQLGRKKNHDRWHFIGLRPKSNTRGRRSNNFLTSGGGSFFTYKYNDEEESMWQKYFNLSILLKNRRKNGKTKMNRLQDLDGGFFEKFGSVLRQKSIQHDESIQPRLEAFPEEQSAAAENGELPTLVETGEDDLQPESDTEESRQEKSTEFIEAAFGWNIEELYEEVLFEIIHNIGCDDEELTSEALFPYVQEAFKMADEKHSKIFEAAQSKEAPEIRLNVEIIEAKDLEPKDSNGLSDPFVTMYIASNPTHRYNTSVKSETLCPLWEEHFSLPIAEDANDANLIVEVWDFDPAETVKEKMNKIFDVKGVRGFRKLMKEIAQTASSGKHDNELIGRTSIPLKSIPASGMMMWYNLDKKNKQKPQGTIKIKLNFSSEKNSHVAAQEHRHLLRILLLHELESSKVAHYWWSGKFTLQGEAVLTQHSAQSGLSSTTQTFTRWSVYTTIHVDHPLSFALFDALLEKLVTPIQMASVSNEELKSFWEATKKLLPSCFSIIRRLRKKNTSDKMTVKTLNDVLNIIAKIASLEPPEGTDLFPMQTYTWIKRSNPEAPSWDIREALSCAVVSGAEDWFNSIKEGHFLQSGLDEDRLQNLIKIIQLVRSDIQKAIEYYDKIFQEIMHFKYTQELYITFEVKLAELIKPTVEDICRKLKRIELPDAGSNNIVEYEDINMGTTLFELYLVLKRFCTLGSALSPDESNFAIDEFHHWFTTGVTHWLDIAVYKALTRIHKAIELDKLQPVDETVKYSSSAVDTLAIFYQIKIFWQQLSWPDVEGAYIFVAKIVHDICRCCDFYADRMSSRVNGLGVADNIYEKKFEVTQEWCLAINNIDYIRQSLKPFTLELGVEDILAKLCDIQSNVESDRCRETLKNVLDNAMDTEKNKIITLVEKLAQKMAPAMRRFLVEGAELLQQDSNSLDRLMMYMEESLRVLNAELNEVNFERVLDAIWGELTTILYDLIQSNLDKRRPPTFFSNLRDTLHIMIDSFKTTNNIESEQTSDKETLAHIERLLQLHGYETTDLIHQYYLDRLYDMEKESVESYGMLTIQCFFKDNVMELEILNARQLKPMDGNGSCDPFVRVHFLPEERFVGVQKPKTQCHSKTLFPMFDEKFIITFSPEQRSVKNALIMFSIKDKDLFGMSNQYLAECYLSFNDIADIASESGRIEQKLLKLTRPHRLDLDCIRALEYRQGDKQAKEFIKKLKQKMGA